MKFGRLMQPDYMMRSKWKPDVEFHYSGRLFFQTESSLAAWCRQMPITIIWQKSKPEEEL